MEDSKSPVQVATSASPAVSGGSAIAEGTAVLEFWQQFDLEARKGGLDKNCTEMRELKTQSIIGRKKLNEITKVFRAKSREEQVNMATEILKAYQEEIDQLSRRAKNTETVFFQMYKAIYEAPDPCYCIQSLIDAVMAGSTHQLEIERLKSELSQYDEEFQRLKNQDITIRRLEDQLQEFRDQNEGKIAAEVSKRVADIQREADDRIQEMRESTRAVEKRMQAAVESMQAAQESADRAQTQLYEASTQADNSISALQSENSILAEGMQRLNMRLAEAESELNALKAHREQALHAIDESPRRVSKRSVNREKSRGLGMRGEEREKEEAEDEDDDSGLDQHQQQGGVDREGVEDAMTYQLLVSSLRDELRQKEENHRAERQRLDSSVRDLTQQLMTERDSVRLLRADLNQRPAREEVAVVKQQLRMLQKIAFNVEMDDEDRGLVAMRDGAAGGGTSKVGTAVASVVAGDPEHTILGAFGEKLQLEALLTARLKVLEKELTQCRNDLDETRKAEAAAKETISSLRKSLEKSNLLINKLESDLENAATASSSAAARGKTAGGGESGVPYQHAGTISLASGFDKASSGATDGLAELLGVAEEGAGGIGAAESAREDVDFSLDGQQTASLAGAAVGGAAGSIGSGSGGGGPAKVNNQMISILQAQRDRYKDRLSTAETALLNLQQQLDSAQGAREQLEADNLALYSKIRFLQTLSESGGAEVTSAGSKGMTSARPMRIANQFGRGQLSSIGGGKGGRVVGGGGRADSSDTVGEEGMCEDEDYYDLEASSSSSSGGRGARGIRGKSGEVESRYHSLYEERMNPFLQFSQRERQRKLRELSVADRVVLNTAMAIVSSDLGRTVLLVYIGAMHLLVFGTMYYTAHHHYCATPHS